MAFEISESNKVSFTRKSYCLHSRDLGCRRYDRAKMLARVGIFGVAGSIRSSKRFIVVHADNEKRFVPKAALVFGSGSATGDYHGQMNAGNFQRWLEE